MDIFDQIISEHREVDGMLKRLSSGYDGVLFGDLRMTLKAHMKAEERSLYPAMSEAEPELVEHATVEHRKIRGLLDDMEQGPKKGSDFSSYVTKLTDVIHDHVADEEREVITRARNMFGPGVVRELTERFNAVDEMVLEKAV